MLIEWTEIRIEQLWNKKSVRSLLTKISSTSYAKAHDLEDLVNISLIILKMGPLQQRNVYEGSIVRNKLEEERSGRRL